MANIFIERSIQSVLDFLKEAVFSEDIARSRGLLQSIGPRVKLLFLVVLLIATLIAKTIPIFIGLYAFSIILAIFSGVQILFFIKRVWFFIPIFTLFIAIPAVFMQGMRSAAVFILRVTTCVSFTVLITITTRHSKLLESLKLLGVPAVFMQVLDMTYRYVFGFITVFEEMHLGLKARLVKNFSAGEARHWIASRIGYLFKRSVRMSEDVYMAMIARGYGIEAKKDER